MTAPSPSNTDSSKPIETVTATDANKAKAPSSDTPEYVAVILCGSAGARMFPLSAEPSSSVESFHDDDFSQDDVDMDEDKSTDDASDTKGVDEKSKDGEDTEGEYRPKHLLPVAGIPILHRLLFNVQHAGFEQCVIACSSLDKGVTLASLKNMKYNHCVCTSKEEKPEDAYTNAGKVTLYLEPPSSKPSQGSSSKHNNQTSPLKLQITVMGLPSTCEGSCDALHYVAKHQLNQHPLSHVLVMPSDLILDAVTDTTDTASKNSDVLGSMVDTHRTGYGTKNVAVTMLLSNVGDEDDQGLPLKESAKQKKGGLARDEEDIEYIALSSSNTSFGLPRVILKRTKVDVEENEDNDASTPKLKFPKYRIRDPNTTNAITTLTTDLSDLHVYIFAPWVVQNLIQMRNGINSIQEDLIPLLISRQFRDVMSVFGKKCLLNAEYETRYQSLISSPPFVSGRDSQKEDSNTNVDDLRSSLSQSMSMKNVTKSNVPPPRPFYCAAHVLPRDVATNHPRLLTLRACAIPSYLYTCKEMVLNAISRMNSTTPSNPNGKAPSKGGKNQNISLSANINPAVSLPDGCQIQAKFNSLILPNTTVGEKLRLQNSTIGSHCTIGPKCKLNNVVIMDNVVIGENCTLQNSVIGTGVVMGENCSLNDCQIGHGVEMAKGTKLKGESLTKN